MSESYSIAIPNEKIATYRLVTLIVAVLNAAAFLYYLANANAATLPYIGLGVAVAALLALLLQRLGKTIPTVMPAALLIACGCTWCAIGIWLPGLLLAVFAAMNIVTQQTPIIHFTEEQIVYPSFPVKKIAWSEVDFALIKDDILSIELKDNRLMQFTLAATVAAAIPTNQFNQFCARCAGNAVRPKAVQ